VVRHDHKHVDPSSEEMCESPYPLRVGAIQPACWETEKSTPMKMAPVTVASSVRRAAIAAALTFSMVCSAAAHPVRLVQSVPEGTTLAAPGTENTSNVWPAMMAAAERSIDLQGFYLTDEARTAAAPFFGAIRDAAKRGVQVRILLDAKFFEKNSKATVDSFAGLPNIEVRQIEFPGVMHAKFFIVDRQRAFLGSQNFDWRAMVENHELGIQFNGATAERLGTVFATDWATAGGNAVTLPPTSRPPRLGRARGPVLAVSPPIPGFPREIDMLVSLADGARRSIDIQVMNYGTRDAKGGPDWTEIRNALARAAYRGVRIRMTVADWQFKAKGSLSDVKAIAKLPGARVRYSTIPPSPEGCIPYARVNHAKYMIVDGDIAWIGTGNWTRDYFYSTRNVTYIDRDPALAKKITGVFETAWSSPYMHPVSWRMPLPVIPDVTCRQAQRAM
jgi:phosphatidylserine/phosphatidylglycerophosphate/cardiolipin synthase-like enzyme